MVAVLGTRDFGEREGRCFSLSLSLSRSSSGDARLSMEVVRGGDFTYVIISSEMRCQEEIVSR